MQYLQHIMQQGEKLSLKDFADQAINHLQGSDFDNEVVKIANEITELENDHMTRPDILHPLPQGYTYRFSGFFGQIIGITNLCIK